MHVAYSKSRPLHDHCPTGSTSWCKYQQDKASRTSTYKHEPGLPLELIAKVTPEYIKLSDSLLEKCLHGKTQNQNEALNGMVWQRIWKEVYFGQEILEMGFYNAVAHFNIGTSPVFEAFWSQMQHCDYGREHFQSEPYQRFVKAIVIDEAHCILEW